MAKKTTETGARGRPAETGDPREITKQFRLDEDEDRILREMLKKHGSTLSDLVRHRLFYGSFRDGDKLTFEVQHLLEVLDADSVKDIPRDKDTWIADVGLRRKNERWSVVIINDDGIPTKKTRIELRDGQVYDLLDHAGGSIPGTGF